MRKTLGHNVRKHVLFYLLLIPALALFAIFRLHPLVKGIVLSFQEFDLFAANKWIGLDNYQKLFNNPMFLLSLKTTVIFTVISVPLMILTSLFLALLLNVKGLRFGNIFRAAIFMPYVTSGVVVSIVWKWFMNESYGLLNTTLQSIGLPPVGWLTDPTMALLSIILVLIWMGCGFYMLIFLSNLQLIPPELYEAAAIDGASGLQQFGYITLSQLRPAFVVSLILCTLNSFRTFTLVYTMTGGGPLGKTELLSYHIYKLAFEKFEFGQASAGMVVMLLIVVGVLVAQLRVTEAGT